MNMKKNIMLVMGLLMTFAHPAVAESVVGEIPSGKLASHAGALRCEFNKGTLAANSGSDAKVEDTRTSHQSKASSGK
jgi:hypothetical protein